MGLITVQEAATKKQVSVKAIYYAVSEGHLTRHEQYGRVLIDEDELEKYVPRAGGDRPSKRRFDASKGGHAPGPLREAFTDWVEVYEHSDEMPLTVQYEDEEKPLTWLLGQLWNCTDTLPGISCEILEMPYASYATAVRKVKEMLPSETTDPT